MHCQVSARERELREALQRHEEYQDSVQEVMARLDNVQSLLSDHPPSPAADVDQQIMQHQVTSTNYWSNIKMEWLCRDGLVVSVSTSCAVGHGFVPLASQDIIKWYKLHPCLVGRRRSLELHPDC